MTRVRFYIGTRQAGGGPVHRTQWVQVNDALMSRFNGFTRYDAHGNWRDGGKDYQEQTRVYEVITRFESLPSLPSCERLAQELAGLTGQTAVLFTLERIEGGFSHAT